MLRCACLVLALLVLPWEPAEASSDEITRAIRYRTPADVKLLLDHGQDVNERNENGWTPLMIAVSERGDVPLLSYLLVTHRAAVNARTAAGHTALMMAARNWNLKIVNILVNANADVNAQDGTALTPLMHTVRRTPESGDEHLVVTILETLLEAGADPTKVDSAGRTVLMQATSAGYTGDVLKTLRAAAKVWRPK